MSTATAIVALIKDLESSGDLTKINGSVVIISSQPHADYQRAVIEETLTQLRANGKDIRFTVSIVAPGITIGTEETTRVQQAKDTIGALGSYIWATTPEVIRSFECDLTADQAKALQELYKSNPLVLLEPNLKPEESKKSTLLRR